MRLKPKGGLLERRLRHLGHRLGAACRENQGGQALNRKDLREQRLTEIAESYDREALLLEKVARRMKHEMELLQAGDLAGLCDSVVGRGEHIDDIARLEARRRELDAELSDDPGPHDLRTIAAREAVTDARVEDARRKAAAAHRRALELDAELREMVRARKAEMEMKLAEIAHGRAMSHAYNGHGRTRHAPVFLDKER